MPADEITDLIARTALGDRGAFSLLYVRTSAKLFGVCLRILKDRGIAEEALQEIYIKIWLGAAGYARGRHSPMSWLIAIARNQAIDRVRSRQPADDDLDEALDLADSGPDPERQAVGRDEKAQIEDCMRQLEPDRARAVRDAYVEGYSYQELADRYHVPLNTMRTWLRRCLLQLRKCLER